jgi:hypothetical protein
VSAQAKADKEAARAVRVEDEMRSLQEQLTKLQQQSIPLSSSPQATASDGGGGVVAESAPSREEWIKILEASPLNSMQAKLAEVETLLRTLLSERDKQT